MEELTNDELKILKIILKASYQMIDLLEYNDYQIYNWVDSTISRDTLYNICEKLNIEL